ncbi:MAG: DnaB-like helicase C-terminal domain-containing protein, partial [Desulfobacterales bacterium]
FDPEREAYVPDISYPKRHINAEILKFQGLLHEGQRKFYHQRGISPTITNQFKIGYNGRYLVYPYIMETGDVYAARCVQPDNAADTFWHGDQACTEGEFKIYNLQEFERCEGGALIVTLGEVNLLLLKELGYPAVSVPDAEDLTIINAERLAGISTLFVLVDHRPEHYAAARQFAALLGFKVRLIKWPEAGPKGIGLESQAAADPGKTSKIVSGLLAGARAFSPLAAPEKEMRRLRNQLHQEQGRDMLGFATGFSRLDEALDGLRGINILGGPPKTGKSCLVMQLATELARRRTPVIYYDFENGRQKIYMRTLTRLSSLAEKKIRTGKLTSEDREVFDSVQREFQAMLTYFRVVTDRRINPEVMRKQIEFLKHETRSDGIMVVVDSLHKLPFKDLSERRTGIDFWLRQMEAIRDEKNVAFLVISELTRHPEGGYTDKPSMGDFKESGDIEYSADNAMILLPGGDFLRASPEEPRSAVLWIVASRENIPGKVADYQLEYPYWRFQEVSQ